MSFAIEGRVNDFLQEHEGAQVQIAQGEGHYDILIAYDNLPSASSKKDPSKTPLNEILSPTEYLLFDYIHAHRGKCVEVKELFTHYKKEGGEAENDSCIRSTLRRLNNKLSNTDYQLCNIPHQGYTIVEKGETYQAKGKEVQYTKTL